jgi:hypothetical protein
LFYQHCRGTVARLARAIGLRALPGKTTVDDYLHSRQPEWILEFGKAFVGSRWGAPQLFTPSQRFSRAFFFMSAKILSKWRRDG